MPSVIRLSLPKWPGMRDPSSRSPTLSAPKAAPVNGKHLSSALIAPTILVLGERVRCGAGSQSIATPRTSATSLRALLQLIESWAMSMSHNRSTTLLKMSDGSSCNAIVPRTCTNDSGLPHSGVRAENCQDDLMLRLVQVVEMRTTVKTGCPPLRSWISHAFQSRCESGL